MSWEAWGEPDEGPEGYVTEETLAEAEQAAFARGAAACRETMARFVEQGGDPVTANSIRLNWNPAWGDEPPRDTLMPADGTGMAPSPPQTAEAVPGMNNNPPPKGGE